MSAKSTRIRGVRLPRAHPPAISNSFLSRKELFSLFEDQTPGATLVVAPAGYGKTMLVSEWVQTSARPTIWYTADISDSFVDFKKHLIDGIEEFIPNWKSLSSRIDNFNGTSSIIDLVKIVGSYPGQVNFVIDFARGVYEGVLPFRQLLIDAVPENVHLIIIRRTTLDTSLSRYASLGNLTLITSEDLKFSDSEVAAVALINNVDLSENRNTAELKLCNGWPAAVQLMCRNISKGNSHSKFTDAITANVNPLNILALDAYNSLSESHRNMILKLSLVEEFDNEIASLILGSEYSESFLNKLVTDGLFITASTTMNRTFRFNPLVYEALTQIPQRDMNVAKQVHSLLAELFLEREEPSKALDHAFASGDKEFFTELFRSNVREMADIGRGDLLIKWSHFAGDDSAHGELMRKTIKIIGHLVNSDFLKAEAMAAELETLAQNGPENSYIEKLCAMVRSHVYFARGDFSRAVEFLGKAVFSPDQNPSSLQSGDHIALLRLAADNAFLHDDFEELRRCHEEAKELLAINVTPSSTYYLNCIKAMLLYSEGQYFQAAEVARIARVQAQENNYGTFLAPLDVLMVTVRCLLEASKLDEAIQTCKLIMELASESKIWPWYFMAEGTIIRIQISHGQNSQAFDEITRQRNALAGFSVRNELGWLVDMSEIFLKLSLKDASRVEELANRMPQIELVRQIQLGYKFTKDSKKTLTLISSMPEVTAREKIQKWLTEASANRDQEKLASMSLVKALDLGAECGYREYFLRQLDLYPLIVKAAAIRPTIYLENLVQDMADRINIITRSSGELEENLTNRELEILKHLNSGNAISQIAKSLHISQNTMKTHLRNMYRKLSADGRHSAVDKAKKLLLI
ncbi:MAG: hypothetical protein F2954_00885 [Actinobacteria bacterium]|uniref:Unannotated protein n=1 Tax=freshwater metagenome TaxID=449393 RepID=A0A6J7VMA3_9ZZZZ|nr:hypothetical protein [Actinomycetota bacterium]